MRVAPCLALAIVALGGTARAQDSVSRNVSTNVSTRTLQIFTAVATNQPLKTRLGSTNDRDLYLVGVRARWLLSRGARLEYAYTADLLPAVVSTGMPTYDDNPVRPCPLTSPCALPYDAYPWVMTRQTTYGAGAVPLGLEMRYRAAPRLALLMRGSAGLVYFSRPVPDPAEPRLNVMFDAGVGGEVRLSPSVGIIAGYYLNHISNAGTGPVNPGMDSRMVEFGLTFGR